MNKNSLNDLNVMLLNDTAERLENIPDSDYFGEKFKGYVSNSALTLINPDQGGSALKFLSGFSDKKTSTALETGTAVHQLLLESDKYIISDVVKPTGKLGDIADELYKIVKQGLDFENAFELALKNVNYYNGRKISLDRQKVIKEEIAEYYKYLFVRDTESLKGICLSKPEDIDKVEGCVNSIKKHPKAKELLFPKERKGLYSYNEDVITMDVLVKLPMDEELYEPIVTLKLKSKIDNWSIDFINKVITLNDLKTTSFPIDQFSGFITDKISLTGELYNTSSKGSFQKYHYYRQMSMYKQMLLSYICKTYPEVDDTWTFNVHMIVVDTNAPYMSAVFKVSDNWLNVGDYEFRKLVNRVAYHTEYGYDNSILVNTKELIIIA